MIAASPVLVEVFNPIWSNCHLNPVQSSGLYINVDEAFTSTLFLNQLAVKLDFYVKSKLFLITIILYYYYYYTSLLLH